MKCDTKFTKYKRDGEEIYRLRKSIRKYWKLNTDWTY